MNNFTMEQVTAMRRDLEKRISIDIATFENDTGLEIDRVSVDHPKTLGQRHRPIVELEVRLPR